VPDDFLLLLVLLLLPPPPPLLFFLVLPWFLTLGVAVDAALEVVEADRSTSS